MAVYYTQNWYSYTLTVCLYLVPLVVSWAPCFRVALNGIVPCDLWKYQDGENILWISQGGNIHEQITMVIKMFRFRECMAVSHPHIIRDVHFMNSYNSDDISSAFQRRHLYKLSEFYFSSRAGCDFTTLNTE